MILFDDVSYTYRTAERSTPAVRGLTLAIHEGESVAILGANGSGKSTLVRLANGLLLPESGRVTVDDADTGDPLAVRRVRTAVGVVFQRPDDQIVATAVEDEVAFGPENLGLAREEIRRRVDESLASVGLSGLERREPHLLSGGQKQRLAIAGALAMSPRYLLLDEPTSMIDPQGRLEVAEVLIRLRREGHAVVVVTHDLMEAAACDRAVVLVEGRCAFDSATRELLGDPALLESFGFEPAPLMRLTRELRARGVPVPVGAAAPLELVGALWP